MERHAWQHQLVRDLRHVRPRENRQANTLDDAHITYRFFGFRLGLDRVGVEPVWYGAHCATEPVAPEQCPSLELPEACNQGIKDRTNALRYLRRILTEDQHFLFC